LEDPHDVLNFVVSSVVNFVAALRILS